MKYPGGKGGAGVYQTIINQIPPHRVYVEPFVGGGNVFERKAPAASSVLMDADPGVVALWRQRCAADPTVTVLQGDALELLSSHPWVGDEFVYCDPPYVLETRKGGALYRVEMSDADHARLLTILAGLPVPFALSGYRGALYDDATRLHGEHPRGSTLWAAAGLPLPGERDAFGGWTLEIDQHWLGHKALKPTWLYIVGVEPGELPPIQMRLDEPTHVIAPAHGMRAGHPRWRPIVTKREREATPEPMARFLVSVAKRCRVVH